jgi:hypothetical protein
LTAEGMEDEKSSLQSKKGRKRVFDALSERETGLGRNEVPRPTAIGYDRPA